MLKTFNMDELSQLQFEKTYNPIKNPLNINASLNGCMFVANGKELSYVEQFIDENRVVTIIDSDTKHYNDDSFYIISGVHYKNRLGFFILEKPYEHQIEIKITN